MAALILTPAPYDYATEDETVSESEGSDATAEMQDEAQIDAAPAQESRRFYPHDFVVQKEKQYPYEWSPNFGVVVEPDHPILSLPEFRDKPKIDPETWNPEDGLEDALYVQWGNSANIRHVKEDEISVVDRVVVKGQKVAKNDGTIGYVTDTIARASVQIIDTHHVIADIDVKDLNPITPFVRGVEILYDNKWVGIITHVRRSNLLRMESATRGRKFIVESIEADGFMKQDPYSNAAIKIPGQRTRLTPRQMQGAAWNGQFINMLWKMPLRYLFPTPEATYLSVMPIGITVKWLQFKPNPSNLEQSSQSSIALAQAPATMYIPAKDFNKVEFIGIPNYETIQLNSIRMYRLDPKDTGKLTSFNAWMSGFRSRFMNQKDNYYGNSFYPPESVYSALTTKVQKEKVPVRVLFKQTYATVAWNDGKTETIPASSIPIMCMVKDSPVHRTGAIVANYFDWEGVGKFGIVQRSEEQVLEKSGTVLVKWFQLADNESVEDLGLQEESIYDLRPHPQYTFYRLHTNVFLKKERPELKSGVVLDIDVEKGTMKVGSPMTSKTVSVYPHEVIPMNQRSWWNFFLRKWENEIMLPHEHHFQIERQVPVREQEPITLPNLNNNSSRPRFQSCLVDESQLAFLDSAPTAQYFYPEELKNLKPNYAKVVAGDLEALNQSVPNGTWVRAYEDRVDLLSVLFLGPINTPYEDGLFLFDMQLPANFPEVPPKLHFISYSDPLNPLIAIDGAFCVSKLEWDWSPENPPTSYIQNTLYQIQKLLFTPDPFFASDVNKAFKDTELGDQFLRVYNEKVFINVLTSAINMLKYPHDPWRTVIGSHYSVALVPKLILAHKWFKSGANEQESDQPEDDPFQSDDVPPPPAYPLLPLSKGFKLALATRLETLDKMLPATLTVEKKKITLEDTGFQHVKADPSELEQPSESTLATAASIAESTDEEPELEAITASD